MTSNVAAFAGDLEALDAWLNQHVATGPVAVIAGKNGDMDTVGSAIALAAHHPSMLACGLHVGRAAQRYVAKHQAPFRRLKSEGTAWPKQLAAIVVVDAAAPEQTGLLLPDVPTCIIDHHATDGWALSNADLRIKWDVRSTTEVITRYLVTHSPSTLTVPVCEFLLAGLVTDTGRLRRFKDEVKEVNAGQECGMAFESYSDLKQGDVIECYEVEEIARSLDG